MSLLFQPATILQLTTALPDGAGAVIFHGPKGVGKFSAAMDLGRIRNCQKEGKQECSCHSCTEWRSGSFPDLTIIKPEEKASIGVEAIRSLTQRLSLAPYYAEGSRIVIIDQAEALTIAAQNALLKLIEEPPSRTNIIIVATSLETLLVTVRSRCRNVFFPALPMQKVCEYLIEKLSLEYDAAKDLAELSNGEVGTALFLHSDPAALQFYTKVMTLLDRFMTGSLFKRLIIAKELSDEKENTKVITNLLYARITEERGASNEATAKFLSGLERLHRQLAANVSARAAYERLAIEMSA
jgi:DNA polymerase-3 subunit delta'